MLSRLRHSVPALAAAIVLAAALTAPAAGLAAAKSSTSIPVVGSVLNGGSFSGVFNLTSFAVQNGQSSPSAR